MERKAFGLSEFKAVQGEPEGTFEALVAVFNNVDRGGDRIRKGAFKRTLEEKGLPPIVWSHNWDVPPIGTVQEAVENNNGLRIKGRLFVGEGDDHPVARQVYTALKGLDGNGVSPLKEFSFGYEVRESANVEEDGQEIRELKDVELFEVGPTLVGMNPDTQLLGVKQAFADATSRVDDPQEKTDPSDANPEPNGEEPEEDSARSGWLALAGLPIHLPPKGD